MINLKTTNGESGYEGLSFNQLLKRLSGQSLTYILGSVGLRFGSLLLLPLLTRYLQPSDYGTISLVTISTLIVGSVLALGMPEAVLRLYFDHQGDENRRYLGSVWVFTLVYSAVIACLIYFFSGPVFDVLLTQVDFDPYIRLAVLIAFFTNFSRIPLVLMRAREQSKIFIICNLVTFLLDVGLRIYFVVGVNQGALGFFKGTMYAHLAMSVFYLFYMNRNISYRIQKKYITESLRLALPLFPSVLMVNVSGVFNRFVMDKHVSLNSMGIYNIGFMLGQVMRMASSAIKTAWVTFYMQVGLSRDDSRDVLAKIATYYFTIIVLLGLGLTVFSREALIILTTEPFYPAHLLVPAFVIAELFIGCYFIFANGITLKKRTEFAPVITGISIAISIAASLLLVPRIGIYGAAYTLIFTNASLAFAALYISQRLYHINYEWRKIITTTVMALVLAGISVIFQIDNLVLSILFHIALVAIWMIGSVFFCFRMEFHTVYSVLRKRLNR